jgi:hypothetical protein
VAPSGVPWTIEVSFAASLLATHPWVAGPLQKTDQFGISTWSTAITLPLAAS